MDTPLNELPANKRFQAHCASVITALNNVIDFLHDPGLMEASLIGLVERHKKRGQTKEEFQVREWKLENRARYIYITSEKRLLLTFITEWRIKMEHLSITISLSLKYQRIFVEYFVTIFFSFFLYLEIWKSKLDIINIYIYMWIYVKDMIIRREEDPFFDKSLFSRFPELEGSNVGSSSPSVGEAIHAGSSRGVEQNFGHDVRENISGFRFLKNEFIRYYFFLSL